MTVIVSPDVERPTHHISLSDGEQTVGLIICDSNGNANPNGISRAPTPRTAMKTTTGNQSYSDFEPPWTPIAQDDWSGGRGLDDFDKDITRFFDNFRTNTTSGKIILGPQETLTTGYRNQNISLPGSVRWVSLISGAQKYLAVKFAASATYDAKNIYVLLRRKGTPTAALTMELCVDSVGNPGAVIATQTVDTTTITDVVSVLHKFVLTSAQALTSTVDYWIKVYSTAGDAENHWEVAVNNAAGTTKESADNSTWETSTVDLFYRVTDTDPALRYKLFQYKRALYMTTTTGTTVKLYINGDRGVADANTGALTTLVDATKTWTVDEWAGCVVVLTGGVGSTEEQPWRTIVSNTATALTLDNAWEITHDTTTEYVILGSNKWTEITGHGIAARPTDILVTNNIVYFALGDDTNIRRMYWYNNSGTATYNYADDSTNKASLLCAVNESGGLQVWRGMNKDSSGAISISKSGSKAWGTNLSFGTAITFKDNLGKITGLAEYGDTARQLWIMREGGVFSESGGYVSIIPLPEMATIMEYTNGIASMVHNVYLYFNLGSGVERYYNKTLDDVGPNRDEGLPSDRHGVISSLIGYPGRYFCAVDAGTSGISSVLCNNGTGWHEVYRAWEAGQRIRNMLFQTIPGALQDRLWVIQQDDVLWLPFPSMTLDPRKDSSYRYTHEGTLTSGYMYAGLYDVYKFYKSLKLFSEGLVEDELIIEAEYQIDESTTWLPISDTFDTSPIQEINLKSEYGETGKRMRYRLRLHTTDNTKTMRIKGIVSESISRVPVKYSYAIPYRLRDNDVDLNTDIEPMSAEEKEAIIDEWAESLTPLVMRSTRKQFDNITVFIDPTPMSPTHEKSEGYAASITVIQV